MILKDEMMAAIQSQVEFGIGRVREMQCGCVVINEQGRIYLERCNRHLLELVASQAIEMAVIYERKPKGELYGNRTNCIA